MGFYVVVHGGAGFHSYESEKNVLRCLKKACSKALSLLEQGATSLDAVEDAVVALENAEPFNAGYGSNLTESGTVECDAAIMDGLQNFGSVGALSGIPNPITVARAVLNHSLIRDELGRLPPMTLVGDGARRFAVSMNLSTLDPKALISARAKRDWEHWNKRIKEPSPEVQDPSVSLMHDTVGAVALDSCSSLAAGVSSGGILHKMLGRLGEAAFFGAGCWADSPRGVACSVSGTGEAIIRHGLARRLCETLVSNDNPESALVNIFENEFTATSSEINYISNAGAILLVKEPEGGVRLWCVCNAPSMALGFASSDSPQPQSIILRQDNLRHRFVDKNGYKWPCFLTVIPWT